MNVAKSAKVSARWLTLVAVVGVAAAACGGDDPVNQSCSEDPLATVEGTTYDASLGVNLADFMVNNAGIYIRDNEVGTGDPARVGDLLRVNYVGRLPNGTIFDQGTFQFQLGGGQVIIGWERGVEGMQEGGDRTLLIPPASAYGLCPIGPIPGNTVLYFDIQLTTIA